jgi:HlyD family secretion protein
MVMKPDFISEDKPSAKPSGRWITVATVVVALAFSGVTLHYVFQLRRTSIASSRLETTPATPTAVSALGYIMPEGEVLHLSVPTALDGVGVTRVAELRVKEGDMVKADQVIAVLDSYETLQTSLNLALEDVNVARTQLAQVKAGAKSGELQAQAATIASLEAELRGQLAAQEQTIARVEAELQNSQIEYQRYQTLFQEGAVTASELDSKRLTMQVAQEQLDEARVNHSQTEATLQQRIQSAQATLDQLAEVRPTDVQAAQAQVERAIANAAKVQAELQLAYIRAPVHGQILEIYTRPGEVVDDQGVIALGQTHQMNVVAEVYETDVNQLKVGQTAIITSNAFSGKLHGTVTQIGLQVNPQDILSTDPTANVDSRVVEVKIRLHPSDSHNVSMLTNLQVNVVIDI